jgi:hypothetical protein
MILRRFTEHDFSRQSNGKYGNRALFKTLFACHGSILKGDNQTTIVGGFKHHDTSPWDEPAEHVLHITLQCCAQQLHRGNN